MKYNVIDIDNIMRIIDKRRLELDALIEKNDIGNIAISEEILQRSKELDELINIVQRKRLQNGDIE